jgi:hypothetical protein
MGLLPAWQLNSNPFPHAGLSLTPHKDPAQLGFYLDLYNWHTRRLLAGLSPGGDIDVNALRSGGTVTVLISGTAGSGRSSMKNLLIYALERAALAETGAKPIILDVPVVPSPDQQSVARSLSFELLTEIAARYPDVVSVFDGALDRWQRLAGTTSADVVSLFQILRNLLARHLPKVEMIVALDASNHALTRDAARATNAMLNSFANYVIMSLTKPDDALFIRDELAGRQTAAWVDAPKVVSKVVKDYVEIRNAAARMAAYTGQDQLYPFHPDAIDYLFKATSGVGTQEVAIGVILEKLNRAMVLKHQTPGQPPSPITVADMKVWFG